MEKAHIITLLEHAWSSRGEGQYEKARSLLSEAQQLCAHDDHGLLGRLHHIYMQLEYDHGRLGEALEFSRISIQHYELAGLPDRIAHAKRHLADIQSRLGALEDAEQHYRDALDIYRSNDGTTPGDLANTLRGFALLLEQRGIKEEAIKTWKEAEAIYAKWDLQAGIDEAQHHLHNLSN